MKKFFLLSFVLFALVLSSGNGQFIRKVLVEEATNASCGPCAAQNPSFQAWIF